MGFGITYRVQSLPLNSRDLRVDSLESESCRRAIVETASKEHGWDAEFEVDATGERGLCGGADGWVGFGGLLGGCSGEIGAR